MRHMEPAEAFAEFCRVVLEVRRPFVGVVKPQAACFERFGAAGVATLEKTCRLARTLGYLVVLDARSWRHRRDGVIHYAASGARLGGRDHGERLSWARDDRAVPEGRAWRVRPGVH